MVQGEVVRCGRRVHSIQHLNGISSETLLRASQISKMISAVKRHFFWPKLKADIVLFITKFQEYQLVKVEHQHPSRFL